MKSLIIFVIIPFSSCMQSTNKESNWKIHESETLKHYQLSFDDIIILNPKEVLLFGDEDTKENSVQMRKIKNLYHTGFAMIYKTQDTGKTWIKQPFDKGGFWHTCRARNTLFATKVVNNGRFRQMTSKLYRSTDLGETWEEISEFIGEAVFLALDENISGYIGGIKSDSSQRNPGVYEIEAGKLKAITDQIQYPANWKAISKEIIYLSTSDKKIKRNDLLCVFDVKSKKLKKHILPEGLDGQFADKDGDDFWVFGRMNGQCAIYKNNGVTGFELVHQIEIEGGSFPNAIKVFGNEIVIVVGVLKSSWAENTTFFSSNGGKTWHEEKLPKPQYLDPFDFIQTENGIFGVSYSGTGTVQTRINK